MAQTLVGARSRIGGRSAKTGPLSPRARLFLMVEAVGLWILVRLYAVHSIGRFPKAGDFFTGPGAPKELHVVPGLGYDGQFTYRLALNPFTTKVTEHGLTFDSPGYRQQRILTPLLAHILAELPLVTVGIAIVLVNAAAVIVAMWAGVRLAEDLGRKPQLGLLIGLPAALPVSVGFDLTEPVAWAGVLLALLAIRRKRWALAAITFTAAVLARETSAILLVGFVIESIVVLARRRDREEMRRLWLLLPIAIETAWQLRLAQVWGSIPALSGFRVTGLGHVQHLGNLQVKSPSDSSPIPLYGIVKSFVSGYSGLNPAGPVIATGYVLDRIVFLALIVTGAAALITRRSRPGIAITVAWVLAAVIALSLRGWLADGQFLRAGLEAWGLSILILVQTRWQWSSRALVGAAVVTGWTVVLYAMRG